MVTRVKVCGLTREEDVAVAVDAGADALGFICGFPESPRNLSLERAGRLVGLAPPFVETVLVTTTEMVTKNLGAMRDIRSSALQLYGDDLRLRDVRKSLGVKIIRPILIGEPGSLPKENEGFDAVMSDTHVAGMLGGTGQTSDWDRCRELKEDLGDIPFILSGGLNAQNVGRAIENVGPFAVDVSSGVEASPGVKDPAKVREFVARAGGRD